MPTPGRTTIAEADLARIGELEGLFEGASHNGWKPYEVHQQSALALMDLASEPTREAFLSALFGVSAKCPGGHVARIHKISNGWDLQLWCAHDGCEWFDAAILNVELKPWGAPVHYSRADRSVWDERKKQGFLIVDDSTPQPGADCFGGTCADHLHSSYRGHPTLPQVVVWPDDGVPRLLVTDHPGDLNQIYGTRGWGYEIARVAVRRIPDGLDAVSRSLVLAELSEVDARLVSLAVTGLWMRTMPQDFIHLTGVPELRSHIPVGLLRRADQWVRDHQA